jgi:colanic acid biosynthesis glycosyl transferase WcaI
LRILILSQHFPPEPITRLRDLTRHLVNRGHDVSVVTTFPSYPLGRVYDGYRLGLSARHEELGASVRRVFAVPYRGVVKGKRMVSYLSFAVMALFAGLLTSKRPAVAYVYHPPLTTGLAAGLYNLLTAVPFIYDVQDLWPEAIVAAGLLQEGSLTYRVMRAVENFVYRRARFVTVISEGMRQNLLKKGVPEEKLVLTSNWGDPDTYAPQNASELRQSLGWQDKFVILLAGNMGLTHGLETVLAAAEDNLEDEPCVLFAFLGAGAAKAVLMERAAARGLRNVVFYDPVQPAEAAQYINAADVMLVHLKPTLDGEFSVPHRIFSFMLCGKPIIVAAQGSTSDLVARYRCGWVCPPSEPVALSAAVRHAAHHPEELRDLGANGLAVAHGEYGREHLLEQVEMLITSV